MSVGLSSNPDGIVAKDRQMLVGPPVDSNPGSGGTPSGGGTDNDTLGDLTPTKGRIVVGNGVAWTVLAVGAQGYVLTVDPTSPVGISWQDPTAPASLYSLDERDLWLYGSDDPDFTDEWILNVVFPDPWLFEDLP